MDLFTTERLVPRLLLTAFAALVVTFATPAQAAVSTYAANLTGAIEVPPNASPGTGSTIVDIDPVAHTMRVRVTFNGLVGTTTACHIHAPTLVAGTGTASVATTTPTFTGFPGGVSAGVYDHTFDMTLATSYNPAFVTANGGSIPASETALFAAIAAGKAYLNVHSNSFPGGEIRGFLVDPATPVIPISWGKLRGYYR